MAVMIVILLLFKFLNKQNQVWDSDNGRQINKVSCFHSTVKVSENESDFCFVHCIIQLENHDS